MIFRTILTFILVTHCLFSENMNEEVGLFQSPPDQLAILRSHSDLLVGGVVHPLSGQLCLNSIDLTARGAQTIHLSRVYIPSVITLPAPNVSGMQEYYDQRDFLYALRKTHRGWQFLPHLRLEYTGSCGGEYKIPDTNGAIYFFQAGKLIDTAGISNFSGEVPTGKSDPRNIRFSKEGESIFVSMPDGTKRTYDHEHGKIYQLKKEILPNGNVLKYLHRGNKIVIQSFGPKEKYEYSSITLNIKLEDNRFTILDKHKDGTCGEYKNRKGGFFKATSTGLSFTSVQSAVTNTKLSSNYSYEGNFGSVFLKKKCGDFKYDYAFAYDLKTASSPTHRCENNLYKDYLLTEYYEKDQFLHCSYSGKPQRIQSLSFPSGEKDVYLDLYTFQYDPPIPNEKGGSTTVTHRDGCKTVYTYSNQLETIA